MQMYCILTKKHSLCDESLIIHSTWSRKVEVATASLLLCGVVIAISESVCICPVFLTAWHPNQGPSLRASKRF